MDTNDITWAGSVVGIKVVTGCSGEGPYFTAAMKDRKDTGVEVVEFDGTVDLWLKLYQS